MQKQVRRWHVWSFFGAALLIALVLFLPHAGPVLSAAERYPSRASDYMGESGLLVVQVVSDGAIGLSYFVIAAVLAFLFFRLSAGITFPPMVAAWSVSCLLIAVVHLFSIAVVWMPVYWLEALVKGAAALAGMAAICTLPLLVSRLRGRLSAEQESAALRESNAKLIAELERLYAEASATQGAA